MISASMIVHNEADRYLDVVLDHLLDFCDEVAVLDDASTDATPRLLHRPGVRVLRLDESAFAAHEGLARDRLLSWTLEAKPEWVLAIDADEVVADGLRLRILAAAHPTEVAFDVALEEAWETDGACLCIREDGGWRTHSVPLFYRAPTEISGLWRFPDLRLACPRHPPAVLQLRRIPAETELLHLGWLNEAEREARYDRYMAVDAGVYHARQHLESIRYPAEQIELRGREWPKELLPYQARIEAAAGRAS